MIDISKFIFDGSKKLDLSHEKPDYTDGFTSKDDAEIHLKANVEKMNKRQELLFAQDKYAILIIFQAMDAAGKDGAISHIMTGLNPQGVEIKSFKQPSPEEIDHDYLWRVSKNLPQRGRIGIFNRSYYEEVLVVRVHNLISTQKIPPEFISDNIWHDRYHQINNFENYLFQNGIIPVKFFLHISKDEQKKRLLDRIEDKSKNWKFSEADIKEREFWDDYQKSYEEAINHTATPHAPWYVIPSDKKWYSRLIISEVIINTLNKLDLKYPELQIDQQNVLEKYKNLLQND